MTLAVLFLICIAQVLSICPKNATIQCNDGNNVNGDGCDANCQIEDGWKCPPTEVIGDCTCYCVRPTNPPTCGCDWVSTGCGAPLPSMADFNKIGVRFESNQQNMVPQGFRFSRCGCNKNVAYTAKDKTAKCPNNAGTSTNEGLVMKVASVPTQGLNYDINQVTWVNWVGTPMRFLTSLERLAFECPPGKVPTEIYFEKAGCNSNTNVSSYAWITKWNAIQYPGCMAGSRAYNDGLSMVAVCRPDASLARGQWMWIDAGFASPIVNPSDLENVAGLCPSGHVMTGAYFNSAGCGQTLKWNQALSLDQISPKCRSGQKGPDGKLLQNGLSLRLKCTRFGRDIHECGVFADHSEAPCDENAQCLNSTFGGTRCVCNQGYEGEGRNGTCSPINICKDNENACAPAPGGYCNMTGPGTYSCHCRAGYTGNGKTCTPAPKTTNNSTNLFPNYQAQCMFGLTGSGITGTINFRAQRDPATGNPIGTVIDVTVGGSRLPKVLRWDIRESSVDTENDSIDSCWDSGKIYGGAGRDGLTSKYGKLRNMKIFDTDIKLWGPTNVIGRSIVLEEEDGDYLDCCTIHIDITDSPFSPAQPTWQPSTTMGTCQFDDGRYLDFAQLNEFVGSKNAGTEDLPGGHSVGTQIRVNPATLIINTQFAAATDALKFTQATAGSPPIEACGNLRLLGGLTSQARGAYMDYTIPVGRYFRSVTIELTYHAIGSWENEWALVQLIVANPAMTFPVWSKQYSGNAACSATTNRWAVKVTYPMARSQNTATIRITSSLDGGGESFAISSFKVTLEPTNEVYTIRNRAFSGSSDLTSWSKVATNGIKTPPAVGPCVTGGVTYALLGGAEVLKSGETLEYRKVVSSFTRLSLKTRFWFLGNWAGQTATIEMINPNDGNQVVPLWTRAFTHNPQSTLNCDASGFKDSYVDVDVAASFKRSASVAYVRLRVSGNLDRASWAVSSWTIAALPTSTSFDIYQDRFRAQRAPGWYITGKGGINKRAVAAADFRQCQNSQSYWQHTWGHDRVVEGGNGREIVYETVGIKPFTQVLINFEFYFLDTWDNEYAKLRVNTANLGEVWSKRWGTTWGQLGWRARRCTHYGGRGYGPVTIASVLVTFPTPQTTLSLTFFSTLDSSLVDESFAVGALRLTILPHVSEMITVTEDVNSARWKFGRVLWSGISQPNTNSPTSDFTGLPKCTIPAELSPAVKMIPGDDRVHNMLGWRQSTLQTRYTTTTSRPYTKALVRFYMWWMDSWNSEWSWVRVKLSNPVIPNSPMRYLFRETFDKRDFFLPSYCNTAGTNYPDETNYRSFIILEHTASTTIDLFWGSTLNQAADNEAFAMSRLTHSTFAEVPFTRLIAFQAGQFNTAAKRAAFKTTGGVARYTICSNEYVLFGYSTANNYIEYNIPAQTAAFTTFRIHFRYWYHNSWDGERSYLYVTSDSGEWVNAMRDDWRATADLQLNGAGNRQGYASCAGGDYRGGFTYDWYQDYHIEVSFAKPTKTARLVWSNNLDQGWTDEAFSVSHITLDLFPIQTGFAIETSSFQATSNALNGFEVQNGGNWAPATVITPCGAAGQQQFLVGGRTRLSPLEKLRFTSLPSEAKADFTTAFIYFRYWFLPTWSAASSATLAVQETGRAGAQATWTMPFPFPVAGQPTNTVANPLKCDVNQGMWKDIGFKVVFPRRIRSIQLTWGIETTPGNTAPRFAISAFKLDQETPFPDWYIQNTCVGAVYRPADGLTLAAAGLNFAVGDMSAKHGAFSTKSFIDNSVLLHSRFSVLGKQIALYAPGTRASPICCTIKQSGPNFAAPAGAARLTAGCSWKNAATEGYVGFRAAPSDTINGASLAVYAKFFGNEANGRHAYSVNYRGFGQPELKTSPTCPATLTGAIYGTGGQPDDFIGPTSAAYALGNPQFPGTPGSSRARIGDLSGKWGTLSPAMAKEIVFPDGQITLAGPFSVVGRSVVIYGVSGAPIGCCTIGYGPVGGPDRGFDFFDALGNFTNPNQVDTPPEEPFDIPDPDSLGALEATTSQNFPYWSAGRIAALAVGIAAAITLIAAIAASAMGTGAPAGSDMGDGYVAM